MTTPTTAPEPALCPTCGNQIGEILNVRGLVLFHAGGAVWRVVRGYCAQCGKAFYWEASDHQLQVVIKGAVVFKNSGLSVPEEKPDGE